MLPSLFVSSSRRMFSASAKRSRFVWVDCEMTGLDADKQTLVEIAVVVTDEHLKTIAVGPDIVIHQNEQVLDKMDDWPRQTFMKNGLLEKIRASKISLKEAEDQVVAFLEEHTEKGMSPLAGNTVYMDRIFLRKYMPRVEAHLHYRIVDVSSIKELAWRWYQKEAKNAPNKKGTHRALDDILESIDELKFYRENIFKK